MIPLILKAWKKIVKWMKIVSVVLNELVKREMLVDPDSARKVGYAWCKDSIGGSWARISEDEFQIEAVSGGLTNYLYMCSLPQDCKLAVNEPRQVLLRLYGIIAMASKDFIVRNSVIFAILAEKKLGPKLYGVYPTGRLEEFIPTRCLRRDELLKDFVSEQIAKSFGRFHQLDMPVCKEPRWISNTLQGWLEEIQEDYIQLDNSDNDMLQKVLSYDLEKEANWVLNEVSKSDSPVVFCHNDLQEGNILYFEECDDASKQFTVIDWEYCSYNYRAFDIANHFCEWTIGYDSPDPPYFSTNNNDYPSKDKQFQFFRHYFEANGAKTVTDDMLEKMYKEVQMFSMVSHFLWSIWGIIQFKTSKIKFGHLDYCIYRLDRYLDLKKSLQR